MSAPSLLQVRALSKSFPGVHALREVNLTVERGEVHCLLGQNGAGKSTLIKILAGAQPPDSGELVWCGEPLILRHPTDALARGIATIYQELDLIGGLSIEDNVFLGHEPQSFGFSHRAAIRTATRALLARVGAVLDPGAIVETLSPAQQQLVSVARALSYRAQVLIMDEPTAVLDRGEVDTLFRMIRELRADGVAIVYISHRLPEVMRLCDQVTVMRDGRVVETLEATHVTHIGERGLASKMVGRPIADHFPKREPAGEKPAIEVRGLTVPGIVNDVSFTVNHGEILGFAGLIGAGRTETAEAICGLRKKSAGLIILNGEPLKIKNVRDAVKAGLAYLSEDRKGTGLTLSLSIAQNITLASLQTWWINRSDQAYTARRNVVDLKIKIGMIHDPVSSLSGGNQQKVALAKWLETSPKVLFVDEPTRGVDIGAKEQIYQLIQSLTRQGMACILISSELNEVIGLSHRIAIMRGGRIVKIVDAATATEESIMHYAAGVTEVTGVITLSASG